MHEHTGSPEQALMPRQINEPPSYLLIVNTTLMQENERLQQQLNDMKTKYIQMQDTTIHKDIKNLEEEVNNLKKENRALIDDTNVLKNSNILLTEQNKKLSKQNEKLVEENKKLNAIIQKLQQTCATLRAENATQRRELNNLKQRLDAIDNSNRMREYNNRIHDLFTHFRRCTMYEQLEKYSNELDKRFVDYVLGKVDWDKQYYKDDAREILWNYAVRGVCNNKIDVITRDLYKTNAQKLLSLMGFNPDDFRCMQTVNAERNGDIHDTKQEIIDVLKETTDPQMERLLRKIQDVL